MGSLASVYQILVEECEPVTLMRDLRNCSLSSLTLHTAIRSEAGLIINET
jgi:hypothetical protein